MPTVAVNINLSSIGTDAGPFTISDNVSGVLATGIPRTSLLANYVVNADDTATQITVTSTGVCTTTLIIPIDFHPCGDTPPPPPPPPPPPAWLLVDASCMAAMASANKRSAKALTCL